MSLSFLLTIEIVFLLSPQFRLIYVDEYAALGFYLIPGNTISPYLFLVIGDKFVSVPFFLTPEIVLFKLLISEILIYINTI